MKKCLLLIDFVNDIVSPQGKFAGAGYPAQCEKYGTLDNAAALLERFRKAGELVVHVRVGFSPDYKELPPASPVLGGAKQFAALCIGSDGGAFYDKLKPAENEAQIIKRRVSAFYGTELDVLLRSSGVTELYICGVSTDMAVQTAAREAHDRDYTVTVVGDCCAAGCETDHDTSLAFLRKIGSVITLAEV